MSVPPISQLDPVREIIAHEVGLRGSRGEHATMVDQIAADAESFARETARDTVLAITAIGRLFTGVVPANPETELPGYYAQSFAKTAAHFALALCRYNDQNTECENPDDVGNIMGPLIPTMFDEFSTVSGLLKLTRGDFGTKRHPVVALSPSSARELIESADAYGFTSTHIKIFAGKPEPKEALDDAIINLQEIKTSPETKGIKDSIARKMAATRRNPILAAQQLEKTVDTLTQEFAEVRTVRRSDVEHFVRNHGVKNAKKEVLDYIDRVAKMSELYADSTVVDLHIIMAICRRSKQPEIGIERILDHYRQLKLLHPDESDKLLIYMARQYGDPEGAFLAAEEKVIADPLQGARKPRKRTSALWNATQKTA